MILRLSDQCLTKSECVHIQVLKMRLLIFLTLMQIVLCDVSHILYEHQPEITTLPPPPKPYAFGYAAGRYPGHIDRTHTEISDGNIVKGSFSYVDPSFKVRTVDYLADKNGFHPILNTPQRLPKDSPVVAAAKLKHLQLYSAIADSHQINNVHGALPEDSASVANAKAKHHLLYQQIAQQHAKIAAERALEAQNHQIIDQELHTPHF